MIDRRLCAATASAHSCDSTKAAACVRGRRLTNGSFGAYRVHWRWRVGHYVREMTHTIWIAETIDGSISVTAGRGACSRFLK